MLERYISNCYVKQIAHLFQNKRAISSYTYDPNSNITSNGSDSYTYDNLNQLTKANYSEKLVNKNSNTYQYDLMGNRKYETQTRINKNGNPVNKVFAYTKNNLNQYQDRLVYTGATTDTEIIPETNTGTILEDLTETGEIEILNTEILPETETNTGETEEEETTTPEEIVDLQGRLLYDKNGNMIGNLLNNKRQYIYSYDYKNRLVKIEKTIYRKINGTETNEVEQITRIVQFRYDVLGRRIKRINNNLTYTKYYYSNQNLIQEEYYTKTNILKNQKNYVYGSQIDDVLRVENIDYKTRKIQQEYVNNKGVTKIRTIREEYTETNTYYYEKDEKGSITKITDKDGTTIEQYLYDAYGTPYTKTLSGELVTISNLKPSQIGNTRLYTGREYDRGLQLYYNRARYYNPQLGRFISRDPIDISDDVNLYTYVGNNPINYIDQSGTEKKWIKENEGNAWYFDEVTTDNIVGHAGLYFIYGGKDYLLSFYPNTNGNVGSSQTEDIFFGVQNSKNDNESIEKIRLDLFLNKKNMYNYIELGNENINSTGLYNRYKKETSNLPGYNTFVNNCSSEVRRGLVAAGFLVDREEALKESINDNLSLTSGYVDNLKLLYNAGSTIIPDTPLTLREEINKQLIKNNLFGN